MPQKHGALCMMGFSKHIEVKKADNNGPSITLDPPEGTSMPGPALALRKDLPLLFFFSFLAMPYSMWDLTEPVPHPVEMQSLNDWTAEPRKDLLFSLMRLCVQHLDNQSTRNSFVRQLKYEPILLTGSSPKCRNLHLFGWCFSMYRSCLYLLSYLRSLCLPRYVLSKHFVNAEMNHHRD